jgi:hypothetical protein
MSRIVLPPAWRRRRLPATAPDRLRSSPPNTSKAARSPRTATAQAARASACDRRHGPDANRSDPGVSRNPHSRVTLPARPAG